MEIPLRRPKGGPRNSAGRESYELTIDQIGNLKAAASYSTVLGLYLNRMITIHWGKAGVGLSEMVCATGRFIDIYRKFLARNSCEAAYVWVHENGDGEGGHCHILIHTPVHLVAKIASKTKKWIKQICGKTYEKKVAYSRPIGRGLGCEVRHFDLWHLNLGEALGYICKGGSAEALRYHGFVRQKFGGLVIGKRCGVSQNISAKARTAWLSDPSLAVSDAELPMDVATW